MEMNRNFFIREKGDKTEKAFSIIFFCLSAVLATVASYAYKNSVPQDDLATQNMRLFFKDNFMEVSQFIRLSYDEQEAFAGQDKHPFYKKYMSASEIEKEKIRALIHASGDYSPNHYWLNIAFLWGIVFTTIWFLCKVIEAILVYMRR